MHGSRGHPRFFVEEPLVGSEFTLEGDEAQHALRVLRLSSGATLQALDGRGGAWNATVTVTERHRVIAKVTEELPARPAPGEAGALLPEIELAIAWPRKSIAKNMLGTLTQLGVARIRPLLARFSGDSPPPATPPEQWHKLVREATKQCGRRHLVRFERPTDVAEYAELAEPEATAVLDPDTSLSLDTWLRSLPPLGEDLMGSVGRPLRMLVGPEGGFAPEELEQLSSAGVSRTRLGPHILRIETAAIAAMSIAACHFGSP